MAYKPILAKYAGSRIPARSGSVLKDFPLEPECNASVRTMLHAARARRRWPCGWRARTSAAEAMEEWLYTNQPG